MEKPIEFRGKPSDEDMIELKKATIKMVADSKYSIIIFIKDDNCHLFMEGDNKNYSVMIGESMVQSKEFRSMIVDTQKL
jgi:hypothetical protein